MSTLSVCSYDTKRTPCPCSNDEICCLSVLALDCLLSQGLPGVPPLGQRKITTISDQPVTMTSGPPQGATLSQRQSLWQMSVLLHPGHTKAPPMKSGEKNPPRGFLAFLLLCSLAPVAHSLCVWCCVKRTQSWEMVTGCQVWGVRRGSLYQRSHSQVMLPLML